MARIRQVHPEMLRDRKLAALSDRAWRTYTGLITVCDDEGYAEDDPVMICSDIFPRGGKSPAQVDADLTELADAKVICRYGHEGVGYLHVLGFRVWQKPQKPLPSRIKVDSPCYVHCPEQQSLFGEGETTVPLQDSYGSDNGQVREGYGTATASSSSSSSSSKKHLAGKPPVSDDFAAFYDAYPRHVGKAAAEKAFAKAVRGGAGRPAVPPSVILAGAKRYADERANQDPQYTKHPATWLNAGCWADEETANDSPEAREVAPDW
jgi:hypothetical protein